MGIEQFISEMDKKIKAISSCYTRCKWCLFFILCVLFVILQFQGADPLVPFESKN